MKGGITLHPQHGVNPTLGLCIWCGKEDGTIGLLGYNKGREAPRRAYISTEPCDACKAGMALGITLIEARRHGGEGGVELVPGVFATGRWIVMKEDAVPRVFDAEMAEALLRARKGFMDVEAYSALLKQYEAVNKGE